MAKRARMATADILPECLIRKIVSCLNLKEAAKMSILSKTWLQSYLTYPNLVFNPWCTGQGPDLATVDKIMERYRDQKISIDRFAYMGGFHADEHLLEKWLNIVLQNRLKDLVLRHCDLRYVLLSTSHTWNLRTLSLYDVHLNENMLRNLLASCPLIVNLIIDHCHGLEKIELRDLQKINSLTVKGYSVKIQIQAPTLEQLRYSGLSMKELHIENYENLKYLEISCREISDGFLELLISKAQFLESLILVSSCLDLGRCRSESLRVLKLQNCKVIGGEIDAPNLVSLVYEGAHIPQLKFSKVPSQLKSLQVTLNCWRPLDYAVWFFELRNMLDSVASSQVSLLIAFGMTKFEWDNSKLQHMVPTPTPPVDVLDVDIEFPKDWPMLVDALLWSCHPKRLNLSLSVQMITCFANRLMHMKSSSRGEPWHTHLKEVKAYKYDGTNQPLELTSISRSGELVITNLTEGEKVYFLLEYW